ncbi:MAG: hypothetical protein KDA84_18315 [Planctomycetaceae bacterium]|nr:hypothetical protein [Planctomycetaceae bacterium]
MTSDSESNGKQGPRESQSGPLVGLGTGFPGETPLISQTQAAAGRSRAALSHQVGFERPLLRHAPTEEKSLTVGYYWRAALVEFFNYGVNTGTVFKSAAFHEPILWRHISWRPEPPNGQEDDSR